MRNNVLYILFFLLLSNSGYAQFIKDLSLSEAFDLALQNSKQVQMDDLKKQAVDIKKQQTRNNMLPQAGVNAGYERLSNNIDPFRIGDFVIASIPNQITNRFYVQQPIFSGLKNWNILKALNLQKNAADFDTQKDKEDTKWNVVETYYTLYKLQQTNNLLDSNIAQTQMRVQDVTRFKNAGLVLNNDVMRAELQKTNLLVNKADVESAINITNYDLCVLLGLDTKTIIHVNSPSIVTDAKYSIASLVSSSYLDRAELKAQDSRIRAADYMIKASKSAYMPVVSLVSDGYVNNPNQRVFPPEARFKATWDVGVTLNWNIMQLYTARAVVNEASNEKAQIKKSTEHMRDDIQMEVNNSYETLKVTLLKIDLAQQAIEQAKENKRILDNRFGAQIALLTDVLDADQFLLQAQTNLLNAQADAAIANYKLQKSLGNIGK
ncbi:MAG: transporter [Bacteroidota bacterium]|nr:transporter [Bacteroidota bacterium]